MLRVVAINGRSAPPPRMPSTHSPKQAEQKLLGQALRNLRERVGLTQRDVATPLGIKPQAWQYYEAGDRRFTHERIAAVLEIVGATDLDFEAEKARILGTPQARASGMAEARPEFIYDIYGRARVGARGPEVYDVEDPLRRLDLRQILGRSIAALEVPGDSMSPWAESGEIVLFDRDRQPRRGKGCVVELKSGEAFVKLYEKSDGSTLFVRELAPEERTITFPLSEVRGVYPVVFRGD
jgi:phage repressor protein C with HTH and peptisase S24 domain